ncbi:hypothetical protein AWW66_07980 [Micromonospora rosaria]|uniref:Uncharacterized protein n=1 Tax=Micromonospora rosaria TaxID=47874 RepID=A0A136PVW9_9ACTN|nr:hypothetical protein [Micromonospora rosaria]KXK62487.1 hypothetical protein AWW66_07980 [Micromonospora rosaria]
MGRNTRTGIMIVVAASGVAAGRALVGAGRRHSRRSVTATGAGRWQVVTVNRPPAEVLPGGLWPEPLRRLDGAVEVQVGTAPGARGTELAARLRADGPPLPGLAAHLLGDDPALLVRRALRQVKQLAETGEVLRADVGPPDRPGDGGGFLPEVP